MFAVPPTAVTVIVLPTADAFKLVSNFIEVKVVVKGVGLLPVYTEICAAPPFNAYEAVTA